MRIASKYPFTLTNGGPTVYNGRVYQKDQYSSWVSYLKSARRHFLSRYQFSSPQEWFAEAYAAYFDPYEDAPFNQLNNETVTWFARHLGPRPSIPDGTTLQPELQTNLGFLREVDDLNIQTFEDLMHYLPDNDNDGTLSRTHNPPTVGNQAGESIGSDQSRMAQDGVGAYATVGYS
ncbi:MAG: hypothetical protein AAF639_28610 [Chloroflexota bacterium]